MNLTDEEWKVLKEYRNLLEKMRKKEDERWKRAKRARGLWVKIGKGGKKWVCFSE